jgi:hypothetical protein
MIVVGVYGRHFLDVEAVNIAFFVKVSRSRFTGFKARHVFLRMSWLGTGQGRWALAVTCASLGTILHRADQ